MMANEKRLNRNLIIGWSVIIVILFSAYLVEVIKGQRTLTYAFVFMLMTGIPPLICGLLYRRNPLWHNLRYCIVAGYFVMYLFVMCSGSTILVFTYILPLLSLIILYHQPKLILYTGIVTMVINAGFIVSRILNHQINLTNSKDVEIQVALLVLCFGACYIGTKMYDDIHRQNEDYVEKLDEKSRQIQRMTLQTIETIANTIDAKDEYTRGHSRRVSEYAARIAKELELSEEDQMRIRYIALLHDIGKIGVPDSVLNKPGKLTAAEFELMRKHTLVGGDILKDIGMVQDLDIGAKYHHERYDGTGYPHGLKGEEIPRIARIICLADAFDAMTSNRIYRKRLDKETVLEELRRCRGTQFDPELVDVFLNYIENTSEWLIQDDNEADSALEDAGSRILQKIMNDQNKLLQQGTELDDLTGAYNRSAGERMILSSMQDNKGCLILINIDNMRNINRQNGFWQGDHYLKQIANMLKEMTTDIIVSRFGGDEFLCFIPNVTEIPQIQEIMDDYMKELRLKKEQGEWQAQLSISAGITIYDHLDTELHQLLMEADKALYHVKQESKNAYYFYRQIADRNDEMEKINWGRVFETIKKRGDKIYEDQDQSRDFVRIYDVVRSASAKDSENVCFVMFTAREKNSNFLSIEEREEAMRMIEYAIIDTMQEENPVTKYSSIQHIVMMAREDEEKIQELTEAVLTNFYKMYDKKDVELYYDISNPNATLPENLSEDKG